MSEWYREYLGMRYDSETFNCAHMVLHVLRNIFNKEVEIGGVPDASSKAEVKQAALHQRRSVLSRTENPKEGDIALIYTRGNVLSHVGIGINIKDKLYILHGLSEKRGFAVTPPERLDMLGQKLEAWYKVK